MAFVESEIFDLSAFPDLGTMPSITSHYVDLEYVKRLLEPQPWLCWCADFASDFCPYCEYDQANRPLKSVASKSPILSSDIAAGTETSISKQRNLRKLRKPRNDCQELQYEALSAEAVLSNRPHLLEHPAAQVLSDLLSSTVNHGTSVANERGRAPERIGASESHLTPTSSGSSSSGISTSQSSIRTVRSKYFRKSQNQVSPGPRPRPLSESFATTALVSLAWTGEVVSNLKASEVVLPSPDNSVYRHTSPTPLSLSNKLSVIASDGQYETQTRLLSSAPRRSVLRKSSEAKLRKGSSRPWTLAMAITDDSITDEKLVDDLESMRIKEKLSGDIVPGPYPLPLSLPPSYYESLNEYPFEFGEVIQDDVDTLSDSSWNKACHALLLCRELVRTERRYLASLKTLITNGTSTQPPSSMLSYLPGLIVASEALLSLMEDNPSVQGVSQAFITCEDVLSRSFVEWCSVVGQFFNLEVDCKIDDPERKMPSPKKQNSPFASLRNDVANNDLPIVIPEPNKIRRNTRARPSVRDLAILPTQRVARYVLLLKELRSLTPSTLLQSHFIEKAVKSAESIAAAANEAQGRLRPPPPSEA
ncbi:hypothetical protein CVT26_002199 [Gymnopilus dilepis]|uniref:DH domain-containing protein n=1 Tax=Gymnopilus dilepis TaxID=231916 RepID=A0A409VBG8_9AGAR|nr:hypothetical protein CVT26_002199 [Gymnopilus dilepis]